MSVLIKEVVPKSVAQKAKIKSGDMLLSINGHEIADVLDFRFYEVEPRLTLELLSSDGRPRTVKLKKDEYEELGLVFETYLMDKQRHCKNKCIFCFVDQMPKGMRKSLYFKDDDTRLSFLFGNYVTLTNLTAREVERIISMHISPINVSVHTTNPELRVKMMANPGAGESLLILQQFAKAGISLNCQLVLCPGLNDGEELLRSLNDLSALYPRVQSIAVVPVGLTKHRQKLYPLEGYDRDGARAVVQAVSTWSNRFLKQNGTRLAFASDEFYIRAQIPLPDYDDYEEFSQLENGVGMVRLFEKEFCDCLEEAQANVNTKSIKASFITGVDAKPLLEEMLRKSKIRFENFAYMVYDIKNEFLGESITVAGLITGQDIINQLKSKNLGDVLIIPDVMLRHEKDRFLDDLTISDIEENLRIPVVVAKADGQGLFACISSLFKEE